MKHFGRFTMAVGLLMVMTQGSCKVIDNLPDDVLASDINKGAKAAVEYGLKYAIKKSPVDAQAIRDNAKIADDVIKNNILPIFSGASTGDVIKSAVDTALAQLWSKAAPQVRDSIQLALAILTANVPLPANPADTIDDRTKKALNGLFGGLAAGIDAVLAIPAATGPSTAREASGFIWSASK